MLQNEKRKQVADIVREIKSVREVNEGMSEEAKRKQGEVSEIKSKHEKTMSSLRDELETSRDN